jgi:hypothetical protein
MDKTDNMVERPPMKEAEFQEFLNENMYNEDGSLKLFLKVYDAVHKFKSVRRAIKRGHVSFDGYIYPKRPFGNTRSKTNSLKRNIYERIKRQRSI